MKRSRLFFTILIAVLTVLVLTALALWFVEEDILYLYLMLGLFGVYALCLAAVFLFYGRQKRTQKTEELLRAGLGKDGVVYLAYFGGERHLKAPSPRKKEYLVEVYLPSVDGERLKRHLWFGLSKQEELSLSAARRYETKLAYPALSLIEGRTVYLPAGFFEAAKEQAAFSQFLSKNTIVLYGEN